MPHTRSIVLAVCLALFLSHPHGAARADEKLAGVACRSVHLGYDAPASYAFYNEVRVHRSAPGSYFMVCGWHAGYFGMQELANGKKLLLFSVWDSKENDANQVPLEQRVQVVHKDEQVRVQRFGGEGSGGQSFFDYEWKPEVAHRFLVQARHDENRTEYAGYFCPPDQAGWRHLITFSARRPASEKADQPPLRGMYSFIEDFRRNKVSAGQERTATFGNPWTRADAWRPILRARFTADANPSLAIDAALQDDRFYLATGGGVKNAGSPLNSLLERPKDAPRPPPADLPKPL